jgi:pimeloyl-ACP methyl ester carboxylesterase
MHGTDPAEARLAYPIFNKAKITVVLFHGALTTGYYWDLVVPYLANNHVLVPDLPARGGSRRTAPFSLAFASSLIQALILEHAPNGIEHVVGHSLGAHIAIALASQNPAVVSKVLVSGILIFRSSKIPSAIQYAIWPMQRLEAHVPRPLIRWLLDGTNLRTPYNSFCTVALCRNTAQALQVPDAKKWSVHSWPAKTLIIAAGKSCILPTRDSPDDAKRLAAIGRRLNNGTRTICHPKLRHPQNRQAPELVAKTCRAWFEDQPISNGFIELDRANG